MSTLSALVIILIWFLLFCDLDALRNSIVFFFFSFFWLRLRQDAKGKWIFD